MSLLTDEELFGSFIPKPTVSKITLKSVGVPPRRLNPHIDDPRTEGTTRTAGVVEGTEASSTNTTVVSAVNALRTVSTDNLTIDLNLSVKDKIKDLQNSWFANISPMITDKSGGQNEEFDLKNYVKIYVFQSTSQNLTQTILQSVNGSVIGQSGRSSDPQIDKLKEKMAEDQYVDQYQEKQLSSIDNPDDVLIEKAPGFTSYYDIPYCVTFHHDQNSPDYLCYFVWAELDLSTLADEFDFGVAGFSVNLLFQDIKFTSQLNHYIALSAGKVPSTVTRYFIDDSRATENNGMAWTGEVRREPDGRWVIWQGRFGGFILRRTTEKNILVQDFRVSDRLNKLNLDFSIIQNSLKGDLSLASKMRTSNLNLDPPQKYFSDIMLTRDMEDNCRFIFSLDVAAIMAANSPFGNLFVNPLTKEECIRQTKILSLSLRRIHLKGSPEIGSKPIYGPGGQAKRFNENNEFLTSFPSSTGAPDALPSSYTTENDELLLKASHINDVWNSEPFDGTTQIDGSMIEDLTGEIWEGDNPKIGVKYFGGVDKTVQFKTDGYYQYKIILEFEDGAVGYLVQSLINLRTAKMKLSEYYAEASKLGTSQLKNPFANPHIIPPLQPLYPIDPGGVRPGNFNVAANRFTQEFKNFTSDRAADGWRETTGGGNDPIWTSVARTYVNTMEQLSGINFTTTQDPEILAAPEIDQLHLRLGQAKKQEMQDAIENYMNPQTGNLEGILKVFSLLESLESIISQAIGRTTMPPSGLAWKKRLRSEYEDTSPGLFLSGKPIAPSPTKKNTTLKSVKIDHTFKNIFNANLPKDTGINIFNYQSETPTKSLSKIPASHFGVMVGFEKNKFFQSSIPDNAPLFVLAFDQGTPGSGQFPINQTLFSYFTPSIIKTPKTIINLAPFGNVESGDSAAWPDTNDWGRVAIADDMSTQQRDLAAVGQKGSDSPSLAQQVASFMAASHNLTSIDTAEPKPATAFDMAIGPRENPPPEISDDVFIRGENKTYYDQKERFKEANVVAYGIFSSISLTLRKGGKKNMSLYSNVNNDGYLNKAKDGSSQVELKNEFGELPNPIKILFAYGDNFQAGASPTSDTTQLLTKNIQQIFKDGGFGGGDPVKMAMRYLFETIYVLEIFTGWENDRMVEIWQTASSDLLAEADHTTTFLCRFRKYENERYGVMASDSSQLPLYEQYFFLEPGSAT